MTREKARFAIRLAGDNGAALDLRRSLVIRALSVGEVTQQTQTEAQTALLVK